MDDKKQDNQDNQDSNQKPIIPVVVGQSAAIISGVLLGSKAGDVLASAIENNLDLNINPDTLEMSSEFGMAALTGLAAYGVSRKDPDNAVVTAAQCLTAFGALMVTQKYHQDDQESEVLDGFSSMTSGFNDHSLFTTMSADEDQNGSETINNHNNNPPDDYIHASRGGGSRTKPEEEKPDKTDEWLQVFYGNKTELYSSNDVHGDDNSHFPDEFPDGFLNEPWMPG